MTIVSGYLACSFDLLNVADLDVIQQARERCDQLTVGVFSDEYIASLNGRAPVVPLAERLTLLRHVRGIDAVVIHDESETSWKSGPVRQRFFAVCAGPEAHELGEPEQLVPRRITASVEIQRATSSVEEGRRDGLVGATSANLR